MRQPTQPARSSELEPESELNGAWPANLIQRTEAAVGAARAEASREHLRRAAELRAGQVVDGRAEVRMIENIEELGLEAKAEALFQLKPALSGQVDLERTESS